MYNKFSGIKSLDALLNRRAFLNDHIFDKDIIENKRELSNVNSPTTPSKSEDAIDNADSLILSDEDKDESNLSEIGLGFTNFFPDANGPIGDDNGIKRRQQ